MDLIILKERLVELLGREAIPLSFDLMTATLNRSLRIVPMEKTVQITAASGSLPLPADFIEVQALCDAAKNYYHPAGQELAAESGQGNRFVVGASSITFANLPADGSVFTLVYYAKLTPLTSDAATNVATLHAPEVVVFQTLSHHAKLIRDGGALQFWEGQAGGAIADANKAAVKSRFAGGTITPSVSRAIV